MPPLLPHPSFALPLPQIPGYPQEKHLKPSGCVQAEEREVSAKATQTPEVRRAAAVTLTCFEFLRMISRRPVKGLRRRCRLLLAGQVGVSWGCRPRVGIGQEVAVGLGVGQIGGSCGSGG